MVITRREWMQWAGRGLATGWALTAGLIPRSWAAWQENAFRKENYEEAVREVFGSRPMLESNQIEVNLPDKWQNGAIVPLIVSTALPQVSAITVFVEKNPTPLAGIYQFHGKLLPFLSLRLKVDGPSTSEVLIVVESAGQLYQVRRTIEVMVGGCS